MTAKGVVSKKTNQLALGSTLTVFDLESPVHSPSSHDAYARRDVGVSGSFHVCAALPGPFAFRTHLT